MSATVPEKPAALRKIDVESGRAPRSETWRTAAKLINNCIGRGRCIIPHHGPRVAQASDVSRTYYYWVWPSHVALQRLWIMQFNNTGSAADSISGTINGSAFSAGISSVGGRSGSPARAHYLEDVATPSAESQEMVVVITTGGETTVTLQSLSCFEVPRVILEIDDGGREAGANEETLKPGSPIAHLFESSIQGVWDATNYALPLTRRSGLLAAAWPEEDPVTVTGTVPEPVFVLPPPLLGRKFYSGDTVRPVRVRARAQATTSNGLVSLTMDSGDTLNLTVTAGGGYSWLEGEIDIDAEDLTDDEGLPSATFDGCTVQIASTGGTDVVDLTSICIGEYVEHEGEDSFTAANLYAFASTAHMDGSATMTRAVLFRLDSNAVGNDFIFSRFSPGAGGWGFRLQATVTLNAWVVDGSIASQATPSDTLTVGETYLAVLTHDGSTIRLYVNGAQVGSGTACSGYTKGSITGAIGAILSSGTSPAETVTILGAAASDSVTLGSTDVLSHYRLSQAIGTVARFDGVENLYSLYQGHTMITDQVGTTDLGTSGSGGTAVATFDPTWG